MSSWQLSKDQNVNEFFIDDFYQLDFNLDFNTNQTCLLICLFMNKNFLGVKIECQHHITTFSWIITHCNNRMLMQQRNIHPTLSRPSNIESLIQHWVWTLSIQHSNVKMNWIYKLKVKLFQVWFYFDVGWEFPGITSCQTATCNR